MDGDEKTARARKQRMRARREADGMAQVSGWVPVSRRAYAREVLRSVAEGANSLPPNPEMVAALDALRADFFRVQGELEAREVALQAARDREASLQVERDAARAAEAVEREKVEVIALEALRRAEKAERTIRQARNLSGIKGRLVRWLAGDVLEGP